MAYILNGVLRFTVVAEARYSTEDLDLARAFAEAT